MVNIWIVSTFTEFGVPKTGLTPSLTIIRLSDDTIVVNSVNMLEISNGKYKYQWTDYDPGVFYTGFVDGGSSLEDNERYHDIDFSNAQNNEIYIDTNQIQSKLPTSTIADQTVLTAILTNQSNQALESTSQLIKLQTDNLPADPASEAAATSNKNEILSSIPSVSGLALEASVQSIKSKI